MKSRKIFVLKQIPFGFLGSVYKCPVISFTRDSSGFFWLRYLRPDGVHNFVFLDNVSEPPRNLFYGTVSTEAGLDSLVFSFRRSAIRFVRSSWRSWRRVSRSRYFPDIDDSDDVPF